MAEISSEVNSTETSRGGRNASAPNEVAEGEMSLSVYQWLTILGIPSLVAGLFGFIRVQMSQNRAINLAVRAMLRDRLLQGYKHYIAQGFADLDDRSNMENVYTQYKALKGNGDMRDLRRTFRHLPMIPGGLPTEVSDDD